VRALNQEDVMMENGKPRKRRQLSPEEKWEVFLEVASQQLTQADAARKWGVDVSTVIRIRQLAKDAALAAFAASKPGRMPSPEQVELEAALQENDRLSEALKELAVELSLHRGRQRSGFSARSRGA
jgi:transposase